jgi:hypothetical protein
MSRGFDPADLAQSRFTGYGPAELPDPRDEELDGYVRGLQHCGSQAIATAVTNASEIGRRVLRAYAERAASRAVRDKKRDLLISASVALVVGGLSDNELEALMGMALVDDASKRTGFELADVFEEVAHLVSHPASVNLMLWLSRAPEDRTPECMGFEAAGVGSAFRYRWTG